MGSYLLELLSERWNKKLLQTYRCVKPKPETGALEQEAAADVQVCAPGGARARAWLVLRARLRPSGCSRKPPPGCGRKPPRAAAWTWEGPERGEGWRFAGLGALGARPAESGRGQPRRGPRALV